MVAARGVRREGRLRAVVEVSDTGCGIPEPAIGRVFEAGFSAQGDTPGLGLAVCKRLVEVHSGEIRVRSRMHRGCTFEMEFPTL
jgi:signal transduction histidine kinase